MRKARLPHEVSLNFRFFDRLFCSQHFQASFYFTHQGLDFTRTRQNSAKMAPTKPDKTAEKEAKLKPEQSASMMLDYLRKQNRPYSATDISANLKNRVTKAAATKLLKDMHERGDIEGKAAGKQIVYHAIQVYPWLTLTYAS